MTSAPSLRAKLMRSLTEFDGNNAPRAEHEGRHDGEQSDWPAAPNRDGLALLDVAVFSRHVPGGKNVGQEKHLLVGIAVGNDKRTEVGKRYPRIFGLSACVAARQMRIAECPSDAIAKRFRLFFSIPVRPFAAGIELHLAHPAFTTRETEWNDYTVTDFQSLVISSHFHNFAHAFVSQHIAIFHRGDKATHQMKVGPANCTRRYLYDGVAHVLDLWVRDRVTANVASTVIRLKLS